MDSKDMDRRNLRKIVFDGVEYVWLMNKEGTRSSCSQCDLKDVCGHFDDSKENRCLKELCCKMIGFFAYFRKR